MTVALRQSRAGTDSLIAQLADSDRNRAASERHAMHSTIVSAGSRILVGLVIAAGVLVGLRGTKGPPVATVPVLTNVATHSDVATVEQCVRSDWAVYFTGAPPAPGCGAPPTRAATKGTP